MTILRFLRDRRGFGAQPEPMILLAILGIAAAIVIPHIAKLKYAKREAETRQSLTTLRSALAAYRKDMGGQYPVNLNELLLGGKYLRSMPKAKLPPHHSDSDSVRLVASGADVDDMGGWVYVAEHTSKDWGTVFVNCTHTDIKGVSWSAY